MVAMTPDQNIKRTWVELEDRKGELPETILVIETDLELLPGNRGWDSGAIDDMIENAKNRHSGLNITFDRVRIVPTSARSP